MKVSGSKGKESLPGRPVVFRRLQKSGTPAGYKIDLIGQVGEPVPEGYEVLSVVHGYSPVHSYEFVDPLSEPFFIDPGSDSPAIDLSSGTRKQVGRIAMDQ